MSRRKKQTLRFPNRGHLVMKARTHEDLIEFISRQKHWAWEAFEFSGALFLNDGTPKAPEWVVVRNGELLCRFDGRTTGHFHLDGTRVRGAIEALYSVLLTEPTKVRLRLRKAEEAPK